MVVIIAGSRSITDPGVVSRAVEKSGFVVSRLISGGARGVDRLGQTWAMERAIPIDVYYPYWAQYGKMAGFQRNRKMAQNAEALIAIWDGRSRGTKSMIDIATHMGLKVFIERTGDAS